MNSVSPVFTEAEIDGERVIALEQEEYYPIIACKIEYSNGIRAKVIRFKLSDKERAFIVAGADLIISQMGDFPHVWPFAIQFAMPGEYPVSEEELL